jgi:F0F1-type ATP synthase alpha subunit
MRSAIRRRQRPDQSSERKRVDVKARHHSAQVGQRADGDWAEGDRCADPDRPRPAQLIIGDRQTGKTAIALDAILNRSRSTPPATRRSTVLRLRRDRPEAFTVAQFVKVLEAGPLECSIIVAATASIRRRCSTSRRSPAPWAVFRDNGMHAVIIYDDLSKQGAIARCRSCCAGARYEAINDVFYLHSRLLERRQVEQEHGSGSLTALPVISRPTTCRPIFRPT